MNWSSTRDLKAQLARLWERGELMRDAVNGVSRFPLRLNLKVPSSAELTQRFDAIRSWAGDLSGASHVRLDWREVQHRVQGKQSLPAAAWIDSIETALDWLGKRREWDSFLAMIALTQRTLPSLVPWLARRPMQALQLADDWEALLAVVRWLMEHPRPGIYLRQVDIPGVHTKFIEANRSVLTELLDLALPGCAIEVTQTGVHRFASRYGFLEKPARIRFRLLDAHMPAFNTIRNADITLDSDSFNRLTLGVDRVFITENETNFLAFPAAENAIVIFGAGYGWSTLSSASWLNACAIHYWGDIDTHGFAILDQLRHHFSHTKSFLMDRETLDAHGSVWGMEEKPSMANLAKLTPIELALYDDLRYNHIRQGLRLEQEFIRFSWLSERLKNLS